MGMIWGLARGYKRPETDERVFHWGANHQKYSGISQARRRNAHLLISCGEKNREQIDLLQMDRSEI